MQITVKQSPTRLLSKWLSNNKWGSLLVSSKAGNQLFGANVGRIGNGWSVELDKKFLNLLKSEQQKDDRSSAKLFHTVKVTPAEPSKEIAEIELRLSTSTVKELLENKPIELAATELDNTAQFPAATEFTTKFDDKIMSLKGEDQNKYLPLVKLVNLAVAQYSVSVHIEDVDWPKLHNPRFVVVHKSPFHTTTRIEHSSEGNEITFEITEGHTQGDVFLTLDCGDLLKKGADEKSLANLLGQLETRIDVSVDFSNGMRGFLETSRANKKKVVASKVKGSQLQVSKPVAPKYYLMKLNYAPVDDERSSQSMHFFLHDDAAKRKRQLVGREGDVKQWRFSVQYFDVQTGKWQAALIGRIGNVARAPTMREDLIVETTGASPNTINLEMCVAVRRKSMDLPISFRVSPKFENKIIIDLGETSIKSSICVDGVCKPLKLPLASDLASHRTLEPGQKKMPGVFSSQFFENDIFAPLGEIRNSNCPSKGRGAFEYEEYIGAEPGSQFDQTKELRSSKAVVHGKSAFWSTEPDNQSSAPYLDCLAHLIELARGTSLERYKEDFDLLIEERAKFSVENTQFVLLHPVSQSARKFRSFRKFLGDFKLQGKPLQNFLIPEALASLAPHLKAQMLICKSSTFICIDFGGAFLDMAAVEINEHGKIKILELASFLPGGMQQIDYLIARIALRLHIEDRAPALSRTRIGELQNAILEPWKKDERPDSHLRRDRLQPEIGQNQIRRWHVGRRLETARLRARDTYTLDLNPSESREDASTDIFTPTALRDLNLIDNKHISIQMKRIVSAAEFKQFLRSLANFMVKFSQAYAKNTPNQDFTTVFTGRGFENQFVWLEVEQVFKSQRLSNLKKRSQISGFPEVHSGIAELVDIEDVILDETERHFFLLTRRRGGGWETTKIGRKKVTKSFDKGDRYCAFVAFKGADEFIADTSVESFVNTYLASTQMSSSLSQSVEMERPVDVTFSQEGGKLYAKRSDQNDSAVEETNLLDAGEIWHTFREPNG